MKNNRLISQTHCNLSRKLSLMKNLVKLMVTIFNRNFYQFWTHKFLSYYITLHRWQNFNTSSLMSILPMQWIAYLPYYSSSISCSSSAIDKSIPYRRIRCSIVSILDFDQIDRATDTFLSVSLFLLCNLYDTNTSPHCLHS